MNERLCRPEWLAVPRSCGFQGTRSCGRTVACMDRPVLWWWRRYVATFASSAIAIQIEQNAGNGSRSDRAAVVSLLTFRALEQQPAYCEAAW